MSFNRENRYAVAKLKDVSRYLTADEALQFQALFEKIDEGRMDDGKAPIECVIVESDWPLYESTWQSIERWVNTPERCSYKENQHHSNVVLPGPSNPPPRGCVRHAGHDGSHKDKSGRNI